MPIPLSAEYIAKLKEGSNIPNTIIELVYTSAIPQIADGTYLADSSITASGESAVSERPIKYGFNTGGFSDVKPIIKNISTSPNRIDTKNGYTTRGNLKFTISSKENFKSIIKDEYLKNRTVIRYDGFVGMDFDKYIPSYTGKITSYSSSKDELTINVGDTLIDGKKKIPVVSDTMVQNIDFTNMNPIDIILVILRTYMEIPDSLIDITGIEAERDQWHTTVIFNRVITEPTSVNELLNELQIETNSYLIHDGQKITLKTFAPIAPNVNVSLWEEAKHISADSISLESGYSKQHDNNIAVFFDYNENGNNDLVNYKTIVSNIDIDSLSPTQWDGLETKIIKSKWFRSFTYTQPINSTGIIIFHTSNSNSTGNGILTYNKINNTLTWKAPSGVTGAPVKLEDDGKYDIFDEDQTKFIRVQVKFSDLPIADQTDTITISTLSAETYTNTLTKRLLARFVDPVPTINCQVDINELNDNGNLRIPASLVNVTSDEMFYKGLDSFVVENCIINSMVPNYVTGKMNIEMSPTKLAKKFGFIAPAGQNDYTSATDIEKQYAYIGDSNNRLNIGTEDGNYIY
jgi:hypothetical protein